MSRSQAITGNYFKFQKKIITNQIRKSSLSQVLQGRFKCCKKQKALIYVIYLKQTVTGLRNKAICQGSSDQCSEMS